MADQKKPLALWKNVCLYWTVLSIVSFGYLPMAILTYTPILWYWPLLIAMTALSIRCAWDFWEEQPRALVLVCVLLFAGAVAMLTRHYADYRETPTGRYLKIESDKWRGKKKVRFVSEDEYVQATTPEYEGDNDPR